MDELTGKTQVFGARINSLEQNDGAKCLLNNNVI